LLLNTISYAYEKSSYYKTVFKINNIEPSGINGIEEIEKIPCTKREDLQENNWEFLAVSKNHIREIVSTTGTTGNPSFIGLTEGDLSRLAENEERSFSYIGVNEGDVFHLASYM